MTGRSRGEPNPEEVGRRFSGLARPRAINSTSEAPRRCGGRQSIAGAVLCSPTTPPPGSGEPMPHQRHGCGVSSGRGWGGERWQARGDCDSTAVRCLLQHGWMVDRASVGNRGRIMRWVIQQAFCHVNVVTFSGEPVQRALREAGRGAGTKSPLTSAPRPMFGLLNAGRDWWAGRLRVHRCWALVITYSPQKASAASWRSSHSMSHLAIGSVEANRACQPELLLSSAGVVAFAALSGTRRR